MSHPTVCIWTTKQYILQWENNTESLPFFSATSFLGLAMVSMARCAGIWTNNTCCLLNWTGTIITLSWCIPVMNISYAMYYRWSSEQHVRTGYICWYICGVQRMLHVSLQSSSVLDRACKLWADCVIFRARASFVFWSYEVIRIHPTFIFWWNQYLVMLENVGCINSKILNRDMHCSIFSCSTFQTSRMFVLDRDITNLQYANSKRHVATNTFIEKYCDWQDMT